MPGPPVELAQNMESGAAPTTDAPACAEGNRFASILHAAARFGQNLARDITVHHNASAHERPAVTSENVYW